MSSLTDLVIGKSQSEGYLVPIHWRDVFLVNKALLEAEDLSVGEGGPALPLLLGRLLAPLPAGPVLL